MSYQTTDISTLFLGCRRQLPAAQKELVRRYAPALLSVARRYARTTVEAEDILQDSFILIFKKIDQYKPEKGSLNTWMRRIVIHTALAQYRKFRHHFEMSVDTTPDASDPEPDVIAKLSFDELITLINTLPPGAREVFNMAVFDEFSHDEIAETLGIPPGTSRALLSRARKNLQQQIIKMQSHELAGI